MNKTELKHLIKEVIKELKKYRPKVQKNKPVKNKFLKNKIRKPKKLRENEQAAVDN